MSDKYTYIDPNEINVGDIVGVLQNIRVGWGYRYYRHQYACPEKITRITPKRTKCIGKSGAEYVLNKTRFVKLDAYAISENQKVNYYTETAAKFSNLATVNRERLANLSDEELKAFGDALDTICTLLDKNSTSSDL